VDTALILIISLSFNLALLFLAGAAFIILYTKINHPAHSDEEKQIIANIQSKSNSIIHRAIKQADKILAIAELRGIKLFAKDKLEADKVANEYRQRLESLEKDLEQTFEQTANGAETTYQNFINSIEAALTKHIQQNQILMEGKTDEFIKYSQGILESFVTDMRNEVKKQVDDELAKAKQEIELYKQRRMKILDENIVEILEKTMAVSLGKKLSLSDQSDLIYNALEEAKKEHALG
jgi:hypothetical protein